MITERLKISIPLISTILFVGSGCQSFTPTVCLDRMDCNGCEKCENGSCVPDPALARFCPRSNPAFAPDAEAPAPAPDAGLPDASGCPSAVIPPWSGECPSGSMPLGDESCVLVEDCAPDLHDDGQGRCVRMEQCAPGFTLDPFGTCYRFRQLLLLASPRVFHTATLLGDGRVAIIGGLQNDQMNPPIEIDIFDPDRESLTTVQSLLAPRAQHQAAVLPNGTVLIAGGGVASGLSTHVELFNPCTSTIEQGPEFPHPRYNLASAILPDGRPIFIGGQYTALTNAMGETNQNISSDCEVYDPWQGAFHRLDGLRTGRTSFALSRLPGDGRLVMSGGLVLIGEHGVPGVRDIAPSLTLEIYDPARDLWSLGCSNCTSRHHHTQTVLPDGRVLIAAGEEFVVQGGMTYRRALYSSEIYDPAAMAVVTLGSLNGWRRGHSATLLPSGRVLVVGGFDQNDNVLATAELFNPATNRWVRLQRTLQAARAAPTLTRLKNGSVLIIGGDETNGLAQGVSAIEIYESGRPKRR